MFEKLFWGYYAAIYDSLQVFLPYQHLTRGVAESLHLEPSSRVLDAGCGTGNVTLHLVNLGYEVVALDSSQPMLARASRKCHTKMVCADLNQPLPFPENTFSGVTCSNALYSVEQPEETLKELHRVLKPGGQIVLSNPLSSFNMGQVMSCHWKGANWHENLAFLVALPRILILIFFNLLLLHTGVKRQLHFASPDQLDSWLQKSGFECLESRPCYAGQGVLAVARACKRVSHGV